MMIMLQYQEYKNTNRIRRFIALITALLMAFTLSACGKQEAVGIGAAAPSVETQSPAAEISPVGSELENLDQSSGKDSPAAKLVEKFFEALRAGDFETTIGCFTPAFQSEYKSALASSSQILKVGSSDLGAIIGAFIGDSTREDYRDYKFEITGADYPYADYAIVSFDVYVGGDFDSTSQIACFKYGDEWYLDDAPMAELTEEATKSLYNFMLYEPFKNGSFAGQTTNHYPADYYSVEFDECDVLVNEDYQIVFQKETDDITWHLPFGDDGYSDYLDKAAKRCAIIDSNGIEQCGFDDTEDTHYEIVGHNGQGVFLLLRHVENVFENGYFISAIDAQGNMLAPEVAAENISYCDYCGEGIFVFPAGTYTYYIYNVNTNNFYCLTDPDEQPLGLREVGFVDGYAYYSCSADNSKAAQIYAVTPEIFASHDTYMAWFESLKKNPDYNVFFSRLKFRAPVAETPPYAFPDTVKVWYSTRTSENYYIVFLKGADRCYYVTLTDAEGVMLYNPIYIHDPYGDVDFASYVKNNFHNSCLAMYDADRKGIYILNPDGTEKSFFPLQDGLNYEVIGYDDSHVYVENFRNSKIIDIETGEVHSTIR